MNTYNLIRIAIIIIFTILYLKKDKKEHNNINYLKNNYYGEINEHIDSYVKSNNFIEMKLENISDYYFVLKNNNFDTILVAISYKNKMDILIKNIIDDNFFNKNIPNILYFCINGNNILIKIELVTEQQNKIMIFNLE
jgi:hypothetical protein